MWPGMRPGDRMDRVEDLDAALLELGREVGDRALGLRDGHAVARHDDDQARVGELDRDVGGAGGAHRAVARRPSAAATAPAPPPKPPKKTLAIERFIASAICLVRIEPDAPTSMPATISAVLSSATPAAAALRPVNAFRVEMTTGMSAPPIGSTAMTPSSPAREQDARRATSASAPRRDRPPRRPSDDRASAALSTVQRRELHGRPEISSCSFAKATFEPQKEIEPMIAANSDRDQRSSSMSPPASRNSHQRDERDRAAADAVEQRHHLRHRGHLHARAAGMPIAVPIDDAERRSGPSRRSVLVEQRRDERDDHAAGGDRLPAHRGARARAASAGRR